MLIPLSDVLVCSLHLIPVLSCHIPQQKVVIDNGSKFVGAEFQEMLESCGIKPHPTTIKNPQVNAVIEHIHGPLGNQLCHITFRGDNFLEDVDAVVQACAYAARTTVPSNIPYSPL